MNFVEYKESIFNRFPITYGSKEPRLGSDIVLALPIIEYYANKCKHVTEFGVREGHSTIALISGCKGKVCSYDIEKTPIVSYLESSTDLPCNWEFKIADTGSPELEIEDTELLMFDTLHTYEHLTKELTNHGRKASRFLLFHDTFTCGDIDKSGHKQEGITRAIEEFMNKYNFEYKEVYRTEANNGFLILERVPEKFYHTTDGFRSK